MKCKEFAYRGCSVAPEQLAEPQLVGCNGGANRYLSRVWRVTFPDDTWIRLGTKQRVRDYVDRVGYLHGAAIEWPHATTDNPHGDPVGVDLFDSVDDGIPMTAIYLRFADGSRWPARTVNMTQTEHAARVLAAWSARGPVHDYRTPAVAQPAGASR